MEITSEAVPLALHVFSREPGKLVGERQRAGNQLVGTENAFSSMHFIVDNVTYPAGFSPCMATSSALAYGERSSQGIAFGFPLGMRRMEPCRAL